MNTVKLYVAINCRGRYYYLSKSGHGNSDKPGLTNDINKATLLPIKRLGTSLQAWDAYAAHPGFNPVAFIPAKETRRVQLIIDSEEA